MFIALKPLFVPGSCQACGSNKDELMTCNGCRSVRYCSQICQKWDWSKSPIKKHKAICSMLARANLAIGTGAMDQEDRGMVLTPQCLAVFATAERLLEEKFGNQYIQCFKSASPTEHVGVSDQEIRKWLDGNAAKLTEASSGAYVGYLKDMFRLGIMDQATIGKEQERGNAYEAVFTGLAECAICRTEVDVKACGECHSVFLCPQHLQHPLHLGMCTDLATRSAIHAAKQDLNSLIKALSPQWPTTPQQLPESWEAYHQILGHSSNSVAVRGLASNIACWPMTILLGLKQASLLGKNKLTLHMVGVEESTELLSDVDYVSHFRTFLPEVQSIKLVCVGPSLKDESLYKSPQLTITTVSGLYEDTKLPPPDAVFIFEGGLSCPSPDGTEGHNWDAGLLTLARLGVPVLCTSYHRDEATSDVSHLRGLGIHVTRQPADNPFASGRKQFNLGRLDPRIYELGPTDMEEYVERKWRLLGQANQIFGFCGMAPSIAL